jgi:Icc-related predicted phosphoesterase
MVRVLAVADEEVPAMESRARDLRVDLVVGAGDLPWGYLETLVDLVGAPAAFVPGNHDPVIARGGPTAPRGMVSVDGQALNVGGLRIAGIGGCVRYNSGPHQYSQREYDARARRLVKALRGRGAVDVLLTHAPPLGLGDEDDPSHVGIAALRGLIETLEPSWHLHGHVHPFGMLKDDRHVGSTTIRNVIPWQVIEIEPKNAVPVAAGAGRRF